MTNAYATIGGWNDPDMLVVGLYGKKGAPSTDLGGSGCTDEEYQSQMSLWCLMAAPLMITCDVRNMNEATRRILSNKDLIAIDQDVLGKQAKRVFKDTIWQVFVKPLANGDIALGILNVSDKEQLASFNLAELGILQKSKAQDLWSKDKFSVKSKIKTRVKSHETKVYRLSKK